MKNENGQEKNAILKGRTLVNCITGIYDSMWSTTDNISYSISTTGQFINFNCVLKPSTKYLVTFDYSSDDNVATQFGFRTNAGAWENVIQTREQGINKVYLTSTNTSNMISIIVRTDSVITTNVTFKNLIILEYVNGMENWNIPYFEGMQSVGTPILTTTGKNLFNKTSLTQGKIINDSTGEVTDVDSKWFLSEYMSVQGMDSVTISSSRMYSFGHRYRFLDKNFNVLYFKNQEAVGNQTYTVPNGSYYFQISVMPYNSNNEEQINLETLMVEQGSIATPYEPYQSNILTVNEPIELRGIGNVADELNLTTGEVTERIGEVVFDGSSDENWIMSDNQDSYTYKRFRTDCLKGKILYSGGEVCNIICDKVVCYPNSTWRDDREGIEHDNIYISFRKNCENITEFKQWLSQNPITIKYALVIPTTKTVDLSIVDQDNQPQDRMKIYPSGYINTSSSTFPPILELKGIVHNNKLNMTTTNGVYTNNVQSLTNPVLDGIICKDGTVVRDSYDVESGLYTKRVFRFTVDEGFIERYRSNFINNASDNNMYELRIDVSQINIPNSKDVVRGISTNMNYNTSISTIKVQNGRVYIRIPKEEVSSYDVNGLLEWIKRNGAIEVAYEMAKPQIIHMQPNMNPYVSTRPYQGEINSQGNALESSFLDYTQEESILSPKPLGDGDVLRWEQGSQCYVYENDKDYIPLTDYNQKVGTVLDLEDDEQFVENLDGGDIIVDVPFKEKAVYERELVSYEDTVIYPTNTSADPDGKVEVDYICGATWQNPDDLSDIQHLGTLREDGQYDVTIRRLGDDEIRFMNGTTHISLDGDGINPSDFELTYFNKGGVEVGKYGDTIHTLENCILDSKLETGTVYGQTLVNLMTEYRSDSSQYNVCVFVNKDQIKLNTKYLMKIKNNSSETKNYYMNEGVFTNWVSFSIASGETKVFTNTTKDSINGLSQLLKCGSGNTTDNDLEVVFLEYQDGMENWNIPYFEGVGSTIVNGFTTTGKNLFDMNRTDYTLVNSKSTIVIQGENEISVTDNEGTNTYVNISFKLDKNFFKGKTVTGSCLYVSDEKNVGMVQIKYKDNTGKIYYQSIKKPNTFTFPEEIMGDISLDIYTNNSNTPRANKVTVKNIQIEYGTQTTEFESYKPQIKHTLPTPITLNKVGDVADTYDVVSGVETRKVGEFTFNGDENWSAIFNSSSSVFKLPLSSIVTNSPLLVVEGLVDGVTSIIIDNGTVKVTTTTEYASISVNNFKNKLKENPITIYAQLKTPQTIQHTYIPSSIQTTQEPTFILPQPLRSVPNGICDRLYWDENKGHYCIEKRIEQYTVDGSDNEPWKLHQNSSASYPYYYGLNDLLKIQYTGLNSLSSIYFENFKSLNGINDIDSSNSTNEGASFHWGSLYIRFNANKYPSVVDVASLRTYFNANPMNLYYPLSTPQIIDLPHLNRKLKLPSQPDVLPIGYRAEHPKMNPQIGLTIPYKQLNPPSQPQNLDFQMNKEDYVLTWNDVKEARQYNVILNDDIVATTKVPWYNTGEEIHGYILVEAQNEIADNLSKELYVKTVPKAPAQLTVAHNGLTDNYDFEISFIKSTSSLADRYTVQYRVDGGEWIIQDIPADEVDANVKVLWKFSVFEIKNQIEVWATATNDMGTNDILPLSTYYMTPTPQWTYRINSREVFLRWVDESPYDTQYKLRYQYKSDGIYRYAHFEGDKEEIGQLYEAVVALAEDDEVTLELCVISDRENLYCKPIKASKALDPNILPPKNFNYRWLSRGLIEFYWEDVYDVDLEYEAIVEHRLSGEISWIEDRRVFSATDTEGTGTVYRLQYQMEDLEEIRVKVRMKWAMNETEWSESLTTVFIPVEGNPPQWIRRTQTQEGLLVEWEAQEYIDSYHVYVKGDGVELQHLETKDNFIYVDIDYSNPIDIEIYEVSRFTGGIEAEPSDSMRFIPHQNKQQMINNIYHPDSLKYEIEVDTVQKAQKASYQINDINTTPDVRTREAMDVSISSPFIITYHPLEVDVHQKGVKSYGVAETHIKTLDVKTRETVEVLTFERITDKYGMDFTVYTPFASKYPVNLEINQVRIVCLGDSLTSGHPLYWAESGTGDVTASYPYQLAKRLKNQYEVINKGYGSDTTDRCLARFDKDVLAYSPQYCLYQCGTNDLYWAMSESMGDQDALDRKLQVMKENSMEIVKRCWDAGIIPIVGTLIPRTGATGIYKTALYDFNKWVISYCTEQAALGKDIFYVDFFNAGKDLVPAEPLEDPNNPGALNPELDGDRIVDEFGNIVKEGRGIHCNARGYWVMASAVPLSIFKTYDSGLRMYKDVQCTVEDEYDDSDKQNPFYTLKVDNVRRSKTKTVVRYVKNIGKTQVLFAIYGSDFYNMKLEFIGANDEKGEYANGLLAPNMVAKITMEINIENKDSKASFNLHLASREYKQS